MTSAWRRTGSFAGLAALIAAVVVPVFTTSAGAATGKAGPQVAGVGIGSKAALAQDTCDAATKRTNFAAVGTGPLCVNPWPAGKSNGGATAPGVTKDSVKVVIYYGNEAMADAERAAGGRLPVNQTTGEAGTWPDSFKDFDETFQYAIEKFGTYQTWGRKPAYEYVEASGPDEAAQRSRRGQDQGDEAVHRHRRVEPEQRRTGVRSRDGEGEDHRERRGCERAHHGGAPEASSVSVGDAERQHRVDLPAGELPRELPVRPQGAVGG